MVRHMRFKKSYGRKSRRSGRSGKRSYGGSTKRRYLRRFKPFSSWKSNSFAGRKRHRFFRKSAPTVSGVSSRYYAKPHRIPTKLFLHKAVASSLLSSMNESTSDFFVNTNTFLSDDLALPENYKPFDSSHCLALSTLNPTNIFTKHPVFYGLDSHTVNPIVKVRRTKIHFSGHNQDLISVFSLFSPLSLSYSSTMELNRIFGMKYIFFEAIFKYLCYMPCVIYSDDAVNGIVNYQIGTLDFFLCPTRHSTNPGLPQAPTFGLDNIFSRLAVVNTVGNRVALAKIFDRIVNELILKANNLFRFDSILVVDTDRNIFDFIPFVSLLDTYTSAANYLNRVQILFAQRFPGRAFSYCSALNNAHLNIAYDMTIFETVNYFSKSLFCLSTCSKEITQTFCLMVADILSYSYSKLLTGRATEREATALSLYVTDIINNRGQAIVDYKHIDSLVQQGVLRIKRVSTRRSVSYMPKSQVNSHWVCINPGVSVKISTVFSRDYSGFMSLFRESVRNDILKKELNTQGLELFRKLEPTYNLYSK